MPRKKIIKQEETGYSFYRRYLEKGIELLDSMSRRHRRVMQTRMDFRYPQEMEIDGSNRDFSRALRDLTKELRKDGYDPQYIGRREQKDQPHQHYHLTLMTNAKKNECRQGIIERAERHWGNALGMTRDEVREKQLVQEEDSAPGEKNLSSPLFGQSRHPWSGIPTARPVQRPFGRLPRNRRSSGQIHVLPRLPP